MSDQHEDDLVANGARALWKADCRVLGYALDSGNASSRWQCNLGKYNSDASRVFEASGITSLIRQLDDAREVLEATERVVLEQRCVHGTPWDLACIEIAKAVRRHIDATLNPEQGNA